MSSSENNIFKQLQISDKEPPKRIKEEVLGSYAMLNTTMNAAELYAVHFGDTLMRIAQLFDKAYYHQKDESEMPSQREN